MSSIKNKIKKIVCKNDAQLLIEILVSILVGGLFLVSATLGIAGIVRYNFESRTSQVAASRAAYTVNFLEQMALSDWNKLYTLASNSTTPYYIVPGATSSLIMAGEEYIIIDEVIGGLVGMWRLDESATSSAYDSSGNMIIATATGTPIKTSTSSCIIGQCLEFNAINQDYVDAGDPLPLHITGELTVSAWINPRSHGSGNSESPRIVTKSAYNPALGGSGRSWELHIEHAGSNSGEAMFQMSSDGTDAGQVRVNSINPVPLNEWNLYTGIYKPSSYIRLYKNGELENEVTQNIPATQYVNSNLFRIGARMECVNCYFDGFIDDVRVYNRALSSEEIKQLYKQKPSKRYFFASNVYRDANGFIAQSPSGNTLDPSTIKIRSVAVTQEGKTISYETYLTRSNAQTLSQSDWGAGIIEGPATSTLTGFATSSNITYTTSLTLATTSASGWLESTTYDTQDQNGGAVHSLLWNGTYPQNTVVKFQIAGSQSSSGPWSYVGPDGTSGTYFTPTGEGVQKEVLSVNNHRYIRYKIFLEPNSGNAPLVDDIHISWAL